MRSTKTRRVKTRTMRVKSRRMRKTRTRRCRRVYKMRGGWGGAISSPSVSPIVMKGGWGGMPTTTNPV